ncbi:MAG: hypothetical protein RLZZ618_4180 [Pseudomonadota bacterium]|jgi:hypothetical protein
MNSVDSTPLSDGYRRLRDELQRLHLAPVKDMKAIDAVIDALEAEQLRLKALDGQHGNNPLESARAELDTR